MKRRTSGLFYAMQNALSRKDWRTVEQLAQMVVQLTGSKSEIRRIPYDAVYGAGFEDMQRRGLGKT